MLQQSTPTQHGLLQSLIQRAIEGDAEPDQIAQAISETFIQPALAELEKAGTILQHAGFREARFRIHRTLEPWGIR